MSFEPNVFKSTVNNNKELFSRFLTYFKIMYRRNLHLNRKSKIYPSTIWIFSIKIPTRMKTKMTNNQFRPSPKFLQ